ncbi:hypothetical protein GUJ93_ZPchr0010g9117 [Zizania palustris]|uniref:Uncharacterized protein n=1 Tax=Zizania palustris TaxID=103762 RepID=A0A8J5WDT5_ZIZPA|nr:hypothetical protein GUJ93_ZPchr0010g9117 [Zizania palustris]
MLQLCSHDLFAWSRSAHFVKEAATSVRDGEQFIKHNQEAQLVNTCPTKARIPNPRVTGQE